MAKYLDGAGLADLWELIKAEDAGVVAMMPFTQFVTGSASVYNSSVTVNLGFKPKLVVIYDRANNDNQVLGNGNSAHRGIVPVILSDAYTATANNYITETGFVTNNGTSTYGSIYYVAFK